EKIVHVVRFKVLVDHRVLRVGPGPAAAGEPLESEPSTRNDRLGDYLLCPHLLQHFRGQLLACLKDPFDLRMQAAVDAFFLARLPVVSDYLRPEYLDAALTVNASARHAPWQLCIDRYSPNVEHRLASLERCRTRLSPWITHLSHEILVFLAERRSKWIKRDPFRESVEVAEGWRRGIPVE